MAQANAKIRITAHDAASKKLQAITRSMTTMLGVATGAYAIRSLGQSIIGLGSDAQETRGKFTAVFKEQTEAALEFVRTTAGALGRSKLDLESWMSTFQDTFVPLGFARDEASKMAQTLTKLSIDLASFNNATEEETISSLQSAMVGNHETMRKYGVIITQTTLSQELMNMGIKKGVQGATEQQKAIARLNIIMASTTDAQGDAARTAGSFANQMRSVKSQIKDIGVSLGTALMPALQSVMPYFDNLAIKIDIFANETLLAFTAMGNSIAHFTNDVVPAYIDYFAQNWQNLMTDLCRMFYTATSNIGKNLADSMHTWGDNFNTLGDNLWQSLQGKKSILEALNDASWEIGNNMSGSMTRGLLDGFKRSSAVMKDIADRQQSPLEQAISQQILDAKNKLVLPGVTTTVTPASGSTSGANGAGIGLGTRNQNQAIAAVESRFLSGKTVKTPTDKNTETLVNLQRKNNILLTKIASKTSGGGGQVELVGVNI